MKLVVVNDKMQNDFHYFLTEKQGVNFHPDFKPELNPKQMLDLGIFGGKYMTDCINEFPKNWFENAILSKKNKNVNLNYFKIDASMPLSHWQEKGWIYDDDPRGWFQWYCRYFMGRRLAVEDLRQIVKKVIYLVEKNKDKLYYIGLMTQERFNQVTKLV